MPVVTVERKILENNETIAKTNRRIFLDKNILTLDLISSPGSGKTTLLEKTITLIKNEIPLGVIEGDVQTDRDAERINALNVPVVQIVTRGGCHLNADLVQDAMQNLPMDDLKLLFIENVGNLICPAEFDLGEESKIVILSTTEGDDKPLKYPHAFRVAKTCVLTKTDLLSHVDFDVDQFRANVKKINPDLNLFQLSAKTGAGMDVWSTWLINKTKHQ